MLNLGLLVSIEHAQAQVLLVKPDLGDCVSCVSSISELARFKDRIPMYAALAPKFKEDVAEIDDRFGLSTLGIPVLLNAKWSAKLGRISGASEICILDLRGEPVYVSTVKKLNMDSAAKWISRVVAEAAERSEEMDCGSASIKYQLGVEKIVVHDPYGKVRSIVKSRDVRSEWISAMLPEAERKKYDMYSTVIREQIRSLHTGFMLFRCYDSVLSVLYEYQSTPDSISSNIRPKHALLRYTLDGKFIRGARIDYPDSLVWIDPNFIEADGKLFTFMLPYRGIGQYAATTPLRTLAQFTLSEGHFKFDSVIGAPLSPFNRDYFKGSFMTVHECEYPCISTTFDNSIYDIRSGTTLPIIAESLYDSVQQVLRRCKVFEDSGNPEIPYMVFATDFQREPDIASVFYKLNGELWLKQSKHSQPWTQRKISWRNGDILSLSSSAAANKVEILSKTAVNSDPVRYVLPYDLIAN